MRTHRLQCRERRAGSASGRSTEWGQYHGYIETRLGNRETRLPEVIRRQSAAHQLRVAPFVWAWAHQVVPSRTAVDAWPIHIGTSNDLFTTLACNVSGLPKRPRATTLRWTLRWATPAPPEPSISLGAVWDGAPSGAEPEASCYLRCAHLSGRNEARVSSRRRQDPLGLPSAQGLVGSEEVMKHPFPIVQERSRHLEMLRLLILNL